jgi:hypothetical protein
MNALSVKRRGREELDIVRHSLEFLDQNILDEMRSIPANTDIAQETAEQAGFALPAIRSTFDRPGRDDQVSPND